MEDQYHDLGNEPKRLDPLGADIKKSYPCLYITMEQFPPMGDMKLSDTGTAQIKFRVKGDNIEVMEIKLIAEPDVQELTPEERLRRRRSRDRAQSGGIYEMSEGL